jgi:hypothetical protein
LEGLVIFLQFFHIDAVEPESSVPFFIKELHFFQAGYMMGSEILRKVQLFVDFTHRESLISQDMQNSQTVLIGNRPQKTVDHHKMLVCGGIFRYFFAHTTDFIGPNNIRTDKKLSFYKISSCTVDTP